jgi:hypothetical protein
MKISKKDFKKLCDIAQKINAFEEQELDLYKIWYDLNNIICNIDE